MAKKTSTICPARTILAVDMAASVKDRVMDWERGQPPVSCQEWAEAALRAKWQEKYGDQAFDRRELIRGKHNDIFSIEYSFDV